MKKYETVVFDLDGTLLNTLEDLADATNYALRTMQMPERTIGEVRAFVGNGVRRLMELSVPGGFDNPKFEETFAVFKKYYGVSNKIDFAVKELNEIYFEGIVQAAIGEREGVARKPAPDMVHTALAELGKPADTAVYIGDSDVDVMTAKNSGLPCISVLWGFRDKEFLIEHGATNFAEKPEDIVKFLEQ